VYALYRGWRIIKAGGTPKTQKGLLLQNGDGIDKLAAAMASV